MVAAAVGDSLQISLRRIAEPVQQDLVEPQLRALGAQRRDVAQHCGIGRIQPRAAVGIVPQTVVLPHQRRLRQSLCVGAVAEAADTRHRVPVAGQQLLQAVQRASLLHDDVLRHRHLRAVGNAAVLALHRQHHVLRHQGVHDVVRAPPQAVVGQACGVERRYRRQRALWFQTVDVHILHRRLIRRGCAVMPSPGQLQMDLSRLIVDQIVLHRQISHGAQQDQHQYHDQHDTAGGNAAPITVVPPCRHRRTLP